METTYSVDANGITVKKLFKSVLIPYAEIRNIVAGSGHNYIYMRNGVTYDIEIGRVSITLKFPMIIPYIEKYNIDYRDMDELKEGQQIYTYEEALQLANRTDLWIRRYANEAVAMQMGRNYTIETRFYDNIETFSGVDMILVKDGYAVELPQEVKDMYHRTETGVFDHMDLFYGPVLWDTEHRCGKYVITEECMDERICERTVFEFISDLCVRYKRVLNT